MIGVTEFVLSQKCMGLWYSNQQILGMKSRTGIWNSLTSEFGKHWDLIDKKNLVNVVLGILKPPRVFYWICVSEFTEILNTDCKSLWGNSNRVKAISRNPVWFFCSKSMRCSSRKYRILTTTLWGRTECRITFSTERRSSAGSSDGNWTLRTFLTASLISLDFETNMFWLNSLAVSHWEQKEGCGEF